jgi:hypothetical protein
MTNSLADLTIKIDNRVHRLTEPRRFNEILYLGYGEIPLEVIHEHDFVLVDTNSHYVQCRTCYNAYCILCGKRISTVLARLDHGVGKCVSSNIQRSKISFA